MPLNVCHRACRVKRPMVGAMMVGGKTVLVEHVLSAQTPIGFRWLRLRCVSCALFACSSLAFMNARACRNASKQQAIYFHNQSTQLNAVQAFF